MPKLPPLAGKLIFPKFWNNETMQSDSKTDYLQPYLPIPKQISDEDLGKIGKANIEEPGFLAFVTEYISKQIQRLNEGAYQQEADHFQIYREVFEWIIEAFNTYKPILAAIKREYDLVLNDYIVRLPNHLHVKEFFHTLNQHGMERICNNHNNELKEIEKLRKEKRGLRKVLWGLTNEMESIEYQIDFLNEEYKKEEYRLLVEDDKRKNLVTENLTLQLAVQAFQSGKSGDLDGEMIDKKALYKEYLEIKNEHKRISSRLRKMAVDYLTNVSKSKYKSILDEFMKLSAVKTNLKSSIDTIRNELETKHKAMEKVEKEKSYYYYKVQQMKYNSGFVINVEQLLDIVNHVKKCFENVVIDDLTTPESQGEQPTIVMDGFHSTSNHLVLAYRHLLEIVLGMPPGTVSASTPEFLRYITDTGKQNSFHDPFNLHPSGKRKHSRVSKRNASSTQSSTH